MTNRELDKLVAEKVMGYDVMWSHFKDDIFAKQLQGESIPHYSTDIAAAWEVVTEMNQCIHNNQLIHVSDEMHNHWEFNISTEDFRGVARAETAPKAICLAALKAVGFNYEEN